MAFNVESVPRLRELAKRLVAAGSKAEHVSCSETHEISEGLLQLLEDAENKKAPRSVPPRPREIDIDQFPDFSLRQEWVNNLQVGDWVFYDFELMQVVDESSTSNGSVRIGGIAKQWRSVDTPVHPMNMKVKRISDCYRFFYSQIHKLEGAPGINWPDIHRQWVKRWHEACLGKQEHPATWPQNFAEEFEKALAKVAECKIDGIQIIRTK